MTRVSRRVSNPPNPYDSRSVEWTPDQWIDEVWTGDTTPEATLEIHEEEAKSILSKNDSPDLAFRWSLNPYRGCMHACAYCYARPTHQYLGFGAGTDFDRQLVVKTNAAALLDARLSSRSWTGEAIVFSGVTDCYQAIERRYELTRRCLEVCVRHGNPVSIVTKSPLVVRDLDLLEQLPDARVHLSIPFLDDGPGRALEPFVASPTQRFRALEELSARGLHVGVSIAPVIPGLNEHEIPGILERASAAGASQASMTLLRLPAETRLVFEERLREACPHHASRVLRGIRELRGGRTNDARFASRMSGRGTRWDMLVKLFETQCARHDLACMRIGAAFELSLALPRRKPPNGTSTGETRRQRELFEN